MVSRVRVFTYVFSAFLIGLISYKSFFYFTYDLPPKFEITGLSEGGTYKSDVNFFAKSNTGYKVSKLLVAVNGKLLESKSIGSSKFEVPVALESLSDGEHVLEVKAIDGSYNANENLQTIKFYIDNSPLKAALLQSDYSVDQGRTVHIKVNLNKQVKKAVANFESKNYALFPEMENSTLYEGFIPIDCEKSPGQFVFNIELQDKVGNVTKLAGNLDIKEYPFKKASGFSVASSKMDDEKKVGISNKVLRTALEKWVELSPKKKLWNGKFEVPMRVQRITTPFGEIRHTTAKGRYMHRAVDLVDMPKSVVWAAQDGNIIIKDRYDFSGNTVVIDHGCGVHTLYYHLEDFAPDIEVGDSIKKGNPIGIEGKTGYATGYHLHWELRVNNIPVDPLQWTKKDF